MALADKALTSGLPNAVSLRDALPTLLQIPTDCTHKAMKGLRGTQSGPHRPTTNSRDLPLDHPPRTQLAVSLH